MSTEKPPQLTLEQLLGMLTQLQSITKAVVAEIKPELKARFGPLQESLTALLKSPEVQAAAKHLQEWDAAMKRPTIPAPPSRH